MKNKREERERFLPRFGGARGSRTRKEAKVSNVVKTSTGGRRTRKPGSKRKNETKRSKTAANGRRRERGRPSNRRKARSTAFCRILSEVQVGKTIADKSWMADSTNVGVEEAPDATRRRTGKTICSRRLDGRLSQY